LIVMPVLRTSEVRKMQEKEMNKKLLELKLELAKTRGNISMGASAQSPGRIKEIRRAIARIKTIESENKDKAITSAKNEKRSVKENPPHSMR
jgi:large subunit ribosomal protein L29